MRFEVYDIDNENEIWNIKKQDPVGYAECELKDIVRAPEDLLQKTQLNFNPKKKKKKLGHIFIKAVESDIGQSKIWFYFGCEDFITKNGIYFSICGPTNNKQFKLYTSEPQTNTPKGCTFDRFTVNANQIADESANLKIEFLELKKSQAGGKLLGDLDICLLGLHNNVNRSINIYKNNQIVGRLKIIQLVKDKTRTFLNYIYPGFCLKTMLALDFTMTKAKKESEEIYDEYVEAISSIGRLLNYYDDDYMMTTYGFGGKQPPYHNVVSHCFALNGNYFNPYTKNLEAIKELYKLKVKEIKEHGPAIVSEIIKFAAEVARYIKIHEPKQYQVLCIITEGDIADNDMAIKEIIKAGDQPFSILQCGIGGGDFSTLKMFDADDEVQATSRANMESERDIVQFINFRKHRNDLGKLARQIFEEIPKQFQQYMDKMNVNPPIDKNQKVMKTKKKEFLKKFESRKKKDSNKIKLFTKMMEEHKALFVKKLVPLGYNPDIIEEILYHGVDAPDFNLMAELIGKTQKEKEIYRNKPIALQAFDGQPNEREKKNRNGTIIKKKSNPNGLTPYQLNKIKPEKELIFTKDEIPDQNSEWLSKKHKSYKVTQDFQLSIEKREQNFQQFTQPKELLEFVEARKIKKAKAKKVKPITYLKKSDELIVVVDDELNKMNRYFGTETLIDNICLNCRKNFISIVFMNCGHAIICENCVDSISDVCPLCKNILSYFIFATNKEIKKKMTENDKQHSSDDSEVIQQDILANEDNFSKEGEPQFDDDRIAMDDHINDSEDSENLSPLSRIAEATGKSCSGFNTKGTGNRGVGAINEQEESISSEFSSSDTADKDKDKIPINKKRR